MPSVFVPSPKRTHNVSFYRKQKLLSVIREQLQRAVKELRDGDLDSVLSVLLSDAASMARLFEAIDDRKMSEKIARDMDTSVREMIPMELWNYLGFGALHPHVRVALGNAETKARKHDHPGAEVYPYIESLP